MQSKIHDFSTNCSENEGKNPSSLSRNTLRNRLLYFLIIFSSILFIGACGNRFSKEDQQLMDSVFYKEYIKSNPKLAEQQGRVNMFYKEREFELAWFKENKLILKGKELLEVINKASDDGMNPLNYHIVDFDKLFQELKASKRDFERYSVVQKEIDLALSATYFLWASDYYRGLIVPDEHKEIEWDVKENGIMLHRALKVVLGELDSKYPLADFKPVHPAYSRLKSALANYRKIQESNGWPKVTATAKLKQDQVSDAIPAMRKRFGLSDSTSSAYTKELVEAVKKFQLDQGLHPDGVLGKETVRLMNISVDERIDQIILNMERMRWLPLSFEPDYLLVNIPEYKLHVFEAGKEKLSMNVIVGKTMNSTPVFSDKMEYIVLSPYWNVPFSIIKEEMASKISANPAYLDRLDMEVVTAKGEQVAPSSINWNEITESNWQYVLRRRPGPKNDLGDVKFIFPNSNDIYLHDTPHGELFNQEKRGFSHGCVRVEKPIELAEYLLRNSGDWSRKQILDVIAKRKEQRVQLKTSLPVYLVYFTAWADEDGTVHFRDDIYGHDKALATKYFAKN